MKKVFRVVLVLLLLTVSIACQSYQIVATDSTWRTTSSDPSGAWTSDPFYDDSGWSYATPTGGYVYPFTIWNGPYGDTGQSLAWFRKTLTITAPLTSASIFAFFDDDGEVYINGALVVNDKNGYSNNPFAVDVLANLHTGTNVIAAHGYDVRRVCKLFGAQLTYETAVPEPSSFLGGAAMLMPLLALRRSRR